MATNSLIGSWHPPSPGCIISKVTYLAHTIAACDVQHNTGFHSPISIWKIRVPVLSSSIRVGVTC